MNESQEAIEERALALAASQAELMSNLVALRKRRNLIQQEVGDRMGVSQPAVAAFEAYDSNPTLSSLRRYALAIGARVEHRVIDDSFFITYVEKGISQIEGHLSTHPHQTPSITFTTPKFTIGNSK